MIKKPKITKGQWTVNSKGIVFHWGKGPETKGYRPCIARVSKWKDGEKEATANQIAISAVPDLIDVVIKSYELTTRELAEETGTPTDELVELATLQEKALEKAGCKLL